jgi:putative hydrolases of HD superfamily
MNNEQYKKITQFLFEMGTMRKLPRIHRQVLLTDDTSDNIASHSYRVTLIGWFLAKLEGGDPYKVTMMCLSHDMAEVRSGDHNWIHKRYVKIFDDEIRKDQLGSLPFKDLEDLALEYEKRESKESIIAKDADLLDQFLLLREYVWQGNKEAQMWLDRPNTLEKFKTESARTLAKQIMEEPPSSWQTDLQTSHNR